jgi:hypothetical protein
MEWRISQNILDPAYDSLSEDDIARMKDGLNPKGWQVHHNLPLDDGGTNDFANLV